MTLGKNVPAWTLVVHPRDENTVVAVVGAYGGEPGMSISQDGGVSWRTLQAPQDPDQLLGGEQAFFTPDGGTLYVHQSNIDKGYTGLIKSSDLGETWSTCETPGTAIRSITGSPHQAGHLVGSFYGEGTLLTRDDCATWSVVQHHQYTSMEWFVYGHSAQELWGVNERSLYRSTDSGGSWSPVLGTDQSIEDLALDPDDPNRLYAVTLLNVWVSADRGSSWEKLNLRGLPFSQRVIAPPGPELEVVAVSRRGIEKSIDGGRSWRAINRGINAESVVRILMHPQRPEEMWAAGWGGLSRSFDSGRTWQWVDTGLEHSRGFTDIQIDPETGELFAAGFSNRLMRSSDNGATWVASDDSSRYPGPFHIVLDPHEPRRVFATADWTSPFLLVFENGGATVDTLDMNGTIANEVFVDPEAPGRLIVAGFRGVQVKDTLNAEPRTTFLTSYDTLLAQVPSQPKHFLVLHPETGNIWRSTDSAETWTEVEGNLAAQIGSRIYYGAWTWQLVVSPHDPEDLFYATSAGFGGLWRSRDGGVTWQRFSDASFSAQTVTFSSQGPEELWVGSNGQGLLHYRGGPLPACAEDDALCLRSGRFEAVVDWQTADGQTGRARQVLTEIDTSGLFWFFEDQNWELMVKVLDGCGLNDNFWVFSAATTDLEYRLRVEDRWTGLSRTYFNLQGQPAKANTDTAALPTCHAAPPEGADTSPPVQAQGDAGMAVDLQSERFRASVVWDTGTAMGDGHLATLGTEDSAIFWFFDPSNWEMLIKVLDGCAVNGHFWVLAATTSDVGYRLRIEDLLTGEVRLFENSPGNPAPTLTETEAFSGCTLGS